MLTQARLKEILLYDQESGSLTWLAPSGRRAKAGAVAGVVAKRDGYRRIGIDGRDYLAHRLAFLYMLGEWPSASVDHKNGNRSDNSWANLRNVSHTVNLQNRRKANTNSKTGVLGVREKRPGRFYVQITPPNAPTKHIGVFSSLAEAEAVHLDVKRRMHEGCTI